MYWLQNTGYWNFKQLKGYQICILTCVKYEYNQVSLKLKQVLCSLRQCELQPSISNGLDLQAPAPRPRCDSNHYLCPLLLTYEVVFYGCPALTFQNVLTQEICFESVTALLAILLGKQLCSPSEQTKALPLYKKIQFPNWLSSEVIEPGGWVPANGKPRRRTAPAAQYTSTVNSDSSGEWVMRLYRVTWLILSHRFKFFYYYYYWKCYCKCGMNFLGTAFSSTLLCSIAFRGMRYYS